MYKFLLLFLPVFCFGQKSSTKETPFSYKEFINLVNYFDNKKELVEFFDFKKGDVIADIGAGEGKYEGAFSLLFDSLTFYIQEIDAKLLNQKKFNKIIEHYSKIKKSPLTNKFYLCLGTEKTTNLPDTIFDKIIILSAIHEFAFMDKMIEDIARKLKPNGEIYIVDTFCTAKGHMNYTAEEIGLIMKKQEFKLIKTDLIQRNSSIGMYKSIFTK